ncbi:MAG: glutamate ligase domain-containing protein [Lawsonibacter sp.]
MKGRIEVVPTPTDYTVLIDYAHTPDALENILTTVRDFTPGRVICLFGCGGDRDRTKRPRMGAVAGALADVAVVTSDNPRTEVPMDIINDILPGLEGLRRRSWWSPTVAPPSGGPSRWPGRGHGGAGR